MLNYRAALDPDEETGLPGAIQDELMACPQTGTGERLGLRWLFKMAKYLQIYCDEVRFVKLILEYSEGCGREVTPQEIADAGNAAQDLHQHERGEYTPNVAKAKITLVDRRQALLGRCARLQEGITFREAQLVWLNGHSHRQIEDRPWVVSAKDTGYFLQRHKELLTEAQEEINAIEWLSLPAAMFPNLRASGLGVPRSNANSRRFARNLSWSFRVAG